MIAALSLIESLLTIITVATVVTAGVGVWIVARGLERREQGEIRHRLRAERDAYRLMLQQHGIPIPLIADDPLDTGNPQASPPSG